jgi:uncharacterized protein YodC (DUF2158 family)
MAASFKLGQVVKLVQTTPVGPVKQLAVDQSGNISYLIEWKDKDGRTQQRWFKESELAAA